jgi:effector-binding domain-containing protein
VSPIVRLENVKAQPLAIVRRRAAQAALKTVIPAACGDVWNRAKAHAVERPGRLVALYLDDVMNIEVGVEVTEAFAGFDDLSRSATPAGRVATATLIGGYERLHDTHAAIGAYCKKHGHRFAGPSWEVYGHATDDPAQMRTDIFYLLQAD